MSKVQESQLWNNFWDLKQFELTVSLLEDNFHVLGEFTSFETVVKFWDRSDTVFELNSFCSWGQCPRSTRVYKFWGSCSATDLRHFLSWTVSLLEGNFRALGESTSYETVLKFWDIYYVWISFFGNQWRFRTIHPELWDCFLAKWRFPRDGIFTVSGFWAATRSLRKRVTHTWQPYFGID